MNRILFFTAAVFFSVPVFSQGKKLTTAGIRFIATANAKPIVLNDSIYSNAFGENYTVTKLRYYISNLQFISSPQGPFVKNNFLADASKPNVFRVKRPKGKIKGISFLLGVDSILNCSGAQSGALDPLNDMFWTWNSGYVMFKLEGRSDSSGADLQRIEQHIGGYRDPYKTMQQVDLYFKNGIAAKFTVKLDLDKYWKGVNEIHISRSPLITKPGEEAMRSANNFKGMFSLIE